MQRRLYHPLREWPEARGFVIVGTQKLVVRGSAQPMALRSFLRCCLRESFTVSSGFHSSLAAGRAFKSSVGVDEKLDGLAGDHRDRQKAVTSHD